MQPDTKWDVEEAGCNSNAQARTRSTRPRTSSLALHTPTAHAVGTSIDADQTQALVEERPKIVHGHDHDFFGLRATGRPTSRRKVLRNAINLFRIPGVHLLPTSSPLRILMQGAGSRTRHNNNTCLEVNRDAPSHPPPKLFAWLAIRLSST